MKDKVHNVNELIVLFEINLDWAKSGGRGRSGEDVSAMFEYAGAHPDEDDAQKVRGVFWYTSYFVLIQALNTSLCNHQPCDVYVKILTSQGYPAIKLKKFFVTNDPWLLEDDTTRSPLPPSFSSAIYKAMNHDLNHLSDDDLEKHFVEWGKNEDRIYSTLPLVIKDWLRKELMKEEQNNSAQKDSTIEILEDYLAALNKAIAESNKWSGVVLNQKDFVGLYIASELQ